MFGRVFNLLTACIGLIIVSPILALIALLIRATSSGPIIFRQNRVGLNEKIFQVYKFRTMVSGAEEIGTSVTTRNDPRMTFLGRVLRKTKFDELPQLINVLKGDMNLVGPRPDVPEIVENYSPEMRRIFKIRPGITSVATLHLQDEEALLASVHDPDLFYGEILVPFKVNLAMEHLRRNSFAFDLRILCQTVWMLTFGRWWPIDEHPRVAELKTKVAKS